MPSVRSRRTGSAFIAAAMAIALGAWAALPAVAVDYSSGLHWVSRDNRIEATAVDVSGGLAYVANAHGLWIYRPDAREGLQLAGNHGRVRFDDVCVEDGLAFITPVRRGGVTLVDVSNPEHPFEVAWIPPQFVGECCPELAASGRYLFVAAVEGIGLSVFDVRESETPRKVDELLRGETTIDVAVEGALVGLLRHDRLDIVDASDPTRLVPTGSVPVDGGVEVEIARDRAYVRSEEHRSIAAFDISDASDPRPLGSPIDIGEGKTNVLTWSDNVVLTSGPDEILVLDVSDLEVVEVIGRPRGTSPALSLARVGSLLVTAGPGGVETFDAPNLAPVDATIARVPAPHPVLGFHRIDDRLLAWAGPGLPTLELDVSAPGAPTLLGNRAPLADGITASGLLYSGTDTGIDVLQLDGPRFAAVAGRYEGKALTPVSVAGDVLLSITASRFAPTELVRLDVSSPASPRYLDTVPSPARLAAATLIDAEHAYASGGGSGEYSLTYFWLVDWSGPGEPHVDQLWFSFGRGSVEQLQLLGNRLYVGYELGDVEVFDVTDRRNPILLQTFEMPEAGGLLPHRGILYGSSAAGVHVADLSEPDSRLSGMAAVGAPAGALLGVGESIYVATGSEIQVLAPDDRALPIRSPGLPTPGRDLAAGTTLHLGGRNPFRDGTLLVLNTVSDGPVELAVFDLGGRRVRTLLSDVLPAGERRIAWDGRDSAGGTVGGGVYFVRLAADGDTRVTRKLTYLGR